MTKSKNNLAISFALSAFTVFMWWVFIELIMYGARKMGANQFIAHLQAIAPYLLCALSVVYALIYTVIFNHLGK